MQYQVVSTPAKLTDAGHSTPNTVLNDHMHKTILTMAFDQIFVAAAEGTDMPAKLVPLYGPSMA